MSSGNLSGAGTPKGAGAQASVLSSMLQQNTTHSNNINTSVNVINFNFYNKSPPAAQLAIPIASDLLLDGDQIDEVDKSLENVVSSFNET